MKAIASGALLAAACVAIGVGLYVVTAGMGWRWGDGLALARRGDVALVLLPVVWIITSLMIGRAMPRRPKPATISGMARKARVVITPELRNRIIAAYIGDGLPSIRDVAKLTTCSYGTVHKIIAEAGCMRPRGIHSSTKVATP